MDTTWCTHVYDYADMVVCDEHQCSYEPLYHISAHVDCCGGHNDIGCCGLDAVMD